MTAQNALGVDVDAECMHGLREGAELLAGLGHEVIEAAPALPGPDGRAVHRRSSARRSRSGSPTASCSPAGRPTTTRSSRCRARSTSSRAHDVGRLRGGGRAAPGARPRRDRVLRRVRPAADARAGRAPAADRRAARVRRGARSSDFARSARFTPFTALFNVTGPAGRVDPRRDGRGRDADQRAARRQAAGRGHAAPGARADGGRAALGAPAPARARPRAELLARREPLEDLAQRSRVLGAEPGERGRRHGHPPVGLVAQARAVRRSSTTVLTRRSCGDGRRSTSPAVSRRSTMPVTLELSHFSAAASSLMVSGLPDWRCSSAMPWTGERPTSWSTAR